MIERQNGDGLLKPSQHRNGKDKSLKFRISGESDSDNTKCTVTRKNISGYSTFLEGSPVTVKSARQRMVVLSITEAETIAAVSCTQDMVLHITRIM